MYFKKLSILVLFALLATLSLSIVQAQESDLGSEDNPIQVYFVPSVEAGIITTGGEVMKAALEEATGLHFEVFVPTSYAATIEAMCASPENSMGFIPAAGFVIANNRCGVEVSAAAVRRGWPVYWAAYIVRRDSGINTFNDLAGKTWAYGDASSTSGYIFPSVELAVAGIEPGDTVETGGHNQTVQAIYNGEADFGTTFYSPPSFSEGGQWSIGDLPEPYDLTVEESFIGDDGQLYVGDALILDARANIRETSPDVIEQVRVLRLSAPIPNDTLSFGPDFPPEVRQQIMDALIEFSTTEAWATSIGNPDFYGWSRYFPIDDATYDIIRQQFEVLGLTEDDIFGG